MRRTSLFVVVSAIALTLTACAQSIPQSDPTDAAPTAPATASPTAPATPSPTTEPAAEPDRLVMSATEVQIVLTDGTVGSQFGYFDPISDVVAQLTELFGQEPVMTAYEGTAAADYDWPGLSVGTDGPGTPPTGAEVIMFVTAAEVAGISIESVDGAQVGDPLAPLEAADPANSYRWQRDGGEELVVTVGSTPISPDEPDREFSVELRALPSDGPITQMGAPMKNFE